jgi:hypothetical protein
MRWRKTVDLNRPLRNGAEELLYQDARFGGRLLGPLLYALAVGAGLIGLYVLWTVAVGNFRSMPPVFISAVFFFGYLAYQVVGAVMVLHDFGRCARRVRIEQGAVVVERFLGGPMHLRGNVSLHRVRRTRKRRSLLSRTRPNYELRFQGRPVVRLNCELVEERRVRAELGSACASAPSPAQATRS